MPFSAFITCCLIAVGIVMWFFKKSGQFSVFPFF